MDSHGKGPGNDGDVLANALRLTAAMAGEEDVAALLRSGLELCTHVLQCERGLLIAQAENKTWQVLERAGQTSEKLSYSTTALRLVDEQREPLLISDTVEDEQLSTQESISRNDIRSVLCTLLDIGDSAFAGRQVYLYLDSSTDHHPLTRADLQRFDILSRLMGNLIRKSAIMADQRAAIEELRSRIDEKQLDDMVFGSDVFKKCLTLISQAAPADVPVLLIGETGTGKERLARLVHDLSPRNGKPFLAVNCGAIPENLMESQLFGHEKGAFTGAVAARKGYFEEAHGGTLFLDEVGELPVQVQSQFLRALQEGEIIRVGSSKPTSVEVRIVAATNVSLEKAVSEGRFRKDLFYRLNVLPVAVPPVRERGEDSLLLAKFFLKKYSESFGGKQLSFSRDAEKAVLVYDWPGNVREIQNKVQRAVITASASTITRDDLGLQEAGPAYATLREAREAVDREMIAHAMNRSPGNLTNAAKILGIDRKSLRILLEKYELSFPASDD